MDRLYYFCWDLNPNTNFNKNIIYNDLNDFHDNSLKMVFVKKKPLVATRQAKSSQNLVIKVRLDVVRKPIAPSENIGLFNC